MPAQQRQQPVYATVCAGMIAEIRTYDLLVTPVPPLR